MRDEAGGQWLGKRYNWHYLSHLLGNSKARPQSSLRTWLLLLKGGSEPTALEVDGLVGNQEIAVKSAGPQLARIPGISGASVLGDGQVVLILQPHILAAKPPFVSAPFTVATQIVSAPEPAPVVLIVDDSLTVRKITGRLLQKAGYHVLTAKDGVDAIEQLEALTPDIVITDIEMPRMDGFELVRRIRSDQRLQHVPLIMVTSRIADKHRTFAKEIGVDHYLGKPYQEDELKWKISALIGKSKKQSSPDHLQRNSEL